MIYDQLKFFKFYVSSRFGRESSSLFCALAGLIMSLPAPTKNKSSLKYLYIGMHDFHISIIFWPQQVHEH